MARINRSDVIQKAVNDLAISTSTDKIPNETLDKVQLTYYLNRNNANFVSSTSLSTTGTVTLSLPSIDTRSEIYLTSIDCALIKDATCDIATSSLSLSLTPFEQGISKAIANFPVISLTAQSERFTIGLPYPIRLKANTSVTLTGTFSLGVMVRSICVSGFIISSN